ncbi:MAG: heptaprenyl diphosphate synthase [Clostridiales bacterium]|nr:MAG: heptaprenyl diphosphate synthase [Clostridiales bacterium]
MKNYSTRKLTMLSLMLAVAITLNYFERFIPISATIPGVRLGLANVVSLLCLQYYGYKDAFLLVILRTVLSAFFYGSLSALMFSLGGGLFALTAMSVLWAMRGNRLSLIGVSVGGAIFHNVGQVTVAYFILATPAIWSYLPFLLVSAVVSGVLTGVVAQRVSGYLKAHIE